MVRIPSYPRLLLATLCLTLGLTLIVAAGTSSASLGPYNSRWDGTAEVRAAADDAGAETIILQNTSSYDEFAQNRTLAVVFSPTDSYNESEAGAVRSFVRVGGTLLVAEDYSDGSNELLTVVGATARVDGRPLRDERRYGPSPAFPRANNVRDHVYTDGVSELMLNHGTAITAGNATAIVNSSSYSYLDTNENEALDDDEELTSHPVVTVEQVGDGTVIVVSDPSIFLNSMLDRSDNAAFLEAIVSQHETVALDVSHSTALPPLIALRLLLQQSGLAAFIGGCISLLALFVIGKPLDISGRIRTWRTANTEQPELTSEEISKVIQTRHPNWNEERVNRVTNRLIARREQQKEND